MHRGPINPKPFPVIWLTGQSGSGKTTIARELFKTVDAVILDGDEMRTCISSDLGMDHAGRHENNIRIAKLAHVLSFQKFVIIAVIAPFEHTRKEITQICSPIWIYLQRESLSPLFDRPYEIPTHPHFIVSTDRLNIRDTTHVISNFLTSIL
jgi:adenylylsulfate kinase-like enzyme